MRFLTKTVRAFIVLMPIAVCAILPDRLPARVLDLQDGSITTIEEFRNRPDRVTRRTESDAKLADGVMRALQDWPGIRVDAEYGVITLTGKVDSALERLEIVRLARSVQGVRDVRAELRVKGEFDEAETIKNRQRTLGLDLF